VPFRRILMISKPVAPPFNDSSKNLVKDLALSGTRFHYNVLTPRSFQLAGPHVTSEGLYNDGGRFTPPMLQNLRVLQRLARRDDTAIAHFFFAPNPRTSLAARAVLRLRPRRTIQTVCSTPAGLERPGGQGLARRIDRRWTASMLFAHRVVVLSRHSMDRLSNAGIDPHRLEMIPPGIQIPPVPSDEARIQARRRHGLPLDQPVVIYPGDYQFSSAPWTVARAVLQPDLRDLPATFVFACRIKQPASLEVERQIRDLLQQGGALPRVRLLREVDDMLGLLSACDLCVLPAESLYAKMDIPLVLLEAMALQIPIVVASTPPLSELAHGRDCGVAMVPPEDPAALAATLRQLLLDSPRRLAMGQQARRSVQQRYDIAEVSRQYEDLYEAVLQE